MRAAQFPVRDEQAAVTVTTTDATAREFRPRETSRCRAPQLIPLEQIDLFRFAIDACPDTLLPIQLDDGQPIQLHDGHQRGTRPLHARCPSRSACSAHNA